MKKTIDFIATAAIMMLTGGILAIMFLTAL